MSSMAPARAAQAVRLVGLPPDEETAVLAVDVHGQSCLQAAALLHVSVDGLAKIRRRAYAKIADDMQGEKESRVRIGHGFFYFSSRFFLRCAIKSLSKRLTVVGDFRVPCLIWVRS